MDQKRAQTYTHHDDEDDVDDEKDEEQRNENPLDSPAMNHSNEHEVGFESIGI